MDFQCSIRERSDFNFYFIQMLNELIYFVFETVRCEKQETHSHILWTIAKVQRRNWINVVRWATYSPSNRIKSKSAFIALTWGKLSIWPQKELKIAWDVCECVCACFTFFSTFFEFDAMEFKFSKPTAKSA